MSDEQTLFKAIFKKPKTIAVYGMSRSEDKAAHTVPAYLLKSGYNIIPINPFAKEILGLKCYKNLKDIPNKIDILEVFRPSEDVKNIVLEAIERRKMKNDIDVIWLQSGIMDDQAKKLAETEGIIFIQDACMYVVHKIYIR